MRNLKKTPRHDCTPAGKISATPLRSADAYKARSPWTRPCGYHFHIKTY